MATVSSLASMAPEPSVSKRSKASLRVSFFVVVGGRSGGGEVRESERKRRVFSFSVLVSLPRRTIDEGESKFTLSLSLSLFVSLFSSTKPTTLLLPDLLLLLLGQAARAGGASSSGCSSGSALGRLAAGRGDGAAVGGLL